MKKIILLTAFVGLFTNCNKNANDLFNTTPTERLEAKTQELLSLLVESPNGWKLIYQSNEKRYGAYSFLTKFDKNGKVTMVSDFNTNTQSPAESLYEIKWGQGPMLSFVTKNHIHTLADASINKIGLGYEGEFEFIYQGIENNQLKFRTQRTNKFVYMVKATEEDWNSIGNFTQVFEDFAKNSYQKHIRVTNNGQIKNYRLQLRNRHAIFTRKESNERYSTGFVATPNGFLFSPSIVIDNNRFSEIIYNDNTKNYTAKAENGSATLEFIVTENPIEEHITNDFQRLVNEIQTNKSLSLNGGTSYFKTFYTTSESFNELVKVGAGNNGDLTVNIQLGTNNEANIVVGYIVSKRYTDISLSVKQEFINNKLYFSEGNFKNLRYRRSNDLTSVWQKNATNKAIYEKVLAMLRKIYDAGTNGFYIEEREEKTETNTDRTVYVLQSGDFYFPTFKE